mmetsp:Transcript_36136/g.90939  ORF Transcript_36136/g.90939 Transcript_36136/m.90939 type:complete len:205 (-) Transcript_36136:561-1175(-)
MPQAAGHPLRCNQYHHWGCRFTPSGAGKTGGNAHVDDTRCLCTRKKANPRAATVPPSKFSTVICAPKMHAVAAISTARRTLFNTECANILTWSSTTQVAWLYKKKAQPFKIARGSNESKPPVTNAPGDEPEGSGVGVKPCARISVKAAGKANNELTCTVRYQKFRGSTLSGRAKLILLMLFPRAKLKFALKVARRPLRRKVDSA